MRGLGEGGEVFAAAVGELEGDCREEGCEGGLDLLLLVWFCLMRSICGTG